MGVAAAQPALVRHCTHCPPASAVPAGAQTGVVPEQAVAPAWSHPKQAFPTQNPRAGSLQSPAFAHSTHTPPMQTGRPPWQSPFTLQGGGATSTATSAATASAVASPAVATAASSEESVGAMEASGIEATMASAEASATGGRASTNPWQPGTLAPLQTHTWLCISQRQPGPHSGSVLHWTTCDLVGRQPTRMQGRTRSRRMTRTSPRRRHGSKKLKR